MLLSAQERATIHNIEKNEYHQLREPVLQDCRTPKCKLWIDLSIFCTIFPFHIFAYTDTVSKQTYFLAISLNI
jgi:hypothetical protein